MRLLLCLFCILFLSSLKAQNAEMTLKPNAIGVNIDLPTKQFHIEGYSATNNTVLYSKVNYTGSSDVHAVEGHSITNIGYGVGGYFTGGYRGVTAIGSGQSYNGSFPVYGIHASSTGTAGTRIGIHAQASGGTKNLAAEFGPGDVEISSNVRIGTTAIPYSNTYKLVVDGKILTEEVRVENSIAWPDYVFDLDYKLMSLDQLELEIKKLKHLPNIPSANYIEENGIPLGQMQVSMMEKIEELTLYIIQLNKELKLMKEEINHVRSQTK